MKIFTDKEWKYLCDKINWGASCIDARAVRIMNKPSNQELDCDEEPKPNPNLSIMKTNKQLAHEAYCSVFNNIKGNGYGVAVMVAERALELNQKSIKYIKTFMCDGCGREHLTEERANHCCTIGSVLPFVKEVKS